MTDIDFQVRLASSADAPNLARLRFTFRSETRDNTEDGTVFIERCSRWMAQRLQNNLWQCWVIERDQTLIGKLLVATY
jgi:hypothetical protein